MAAEQYSALYTHYSGEYDYYTSHSEGGLSFKSIMLQFQTHCGIKTKHRKRELWFITVISFRNRDPRTMQALREVGVSCNGYSVAAMEVFRSLLEPFIRSTAAHQPPTAAHIGSITAFR